MADGGPTQVFAEGAPRVIVAGATGFAGALAAHLLWRHPRFQLLAVTGRSEVGAHLDRLYPRYRVPLRIEQLELDELEQIDAAVVAYPACRRRAHGRAPCASAAPASST